MGDDDDTLKEPKTNVVSLSVVNGEKSEDPETSEIIMQLYSIIEEIRKGNLTTLLAFALDKEGGYTRVIMSKNRFEALGLNEIVHDMVKAALEPIDD